MYFALLYHHIGENEPQKGDWNSVIYVISFEEGK